MNKDDIFADSDKMSDFNKNFMQNLQWVEDSLPNTLTRNTRFDLPSEIIQTSSEQRLLQIIQFITDKHDSGNPRVDYIEILFNISAHGNTNLVRKTALEKLINIFSKTNTSISIPIKFLNDLQPDEIETLSQWSERLKKRKQKSSVEKYPNYWFETDDIEDFANSYMSSSVMKNPITKNSKVITLGSCFAANIVYSLWSLGFVADWYNFPEHVNNSYANAFLFDVMHGNTKFTETSISKRKQIVEDIERFFSALPHATHVIFTLGLSFAFYNKRSGEPLREPLWSHDSELYQEYDMKPIPIEENIANLKFIIKCINDVSPNAEIILSLSPIPLDGVKGYNGSVIEADCISKSIGRASIGYLQQEPQDLFYYFPSYELVRWVAANQDRRLFGGENDAHLRHIHPSILREILSIFLTRNCVA